LNCSRCKAYLQAKVEVLDLFQTLWGLIEQPRPTFQRIVRARRKNFSVVLAALLGINVSFFLLWAWQAGRRFETVAELGMAGTVAGIPLGISLVWLLSSWGGFLSKRLGGRGGGKNFFAVIAFAGAPLMYALVLVLPAELAVFGKYLFDRNPDPMAMKPGVYLALAGFDVLSALWAAGLLHVGLSEASGIRRWRGLVLTLGVLGCAAAMIAGAALVRL
jgi:hypothetical protein